MPPIATHDQFDPSIHEKYPTKENALASVTLPISARAKVGPVIKQLRDDSFVGLQTDRQKLSTCLLRS
jgi:hypothetical protein